MLLRSPSTTSRGVPLVSLSSKTPSSSLSISGFFPKFRKLKLTKGVAPLRRTQTIHSCCAEEFGDCGESKMSTLQSAPSFDIYNSTEESIEYGEGISLIMIAKDETLERSVTIGDNVDCDFTFGKKKMGLIKEEEEGGFGEESADSVSPLLCLAAGIGIDADSDGKVVEFNQESFSENGDVEEYYKRMLCDYPSDPLILRNYAQLLQSKGDLLSAEDYYYRASLADPGDGEIWLQYAKLIWELHHDQEKATIYFERAVQASASDSNILAAYASFLWETDNDDEYNRGNVNQIQTAEDNSLSNINKSAPENVHQPVSPSSQLKAGSQIDMAGLDIGEARNVNEYYRKLIEENPSTPLFLRNYAHFLHQSKGDVQGAEEYYLRAILTDPEDGITMSEYASLVWEHHHDRAKASSYFQRAAQASPEDCHVLAANAKFLWETEEEDEQQEEAVPVFQKEAVASANA